MMVGAVVVSTGLGINACASVPSADSVLNPDLEVSGSGFAGAVVVLADGAVGLGCWAARAGMRSAEIEKSATSNFCIKKTGYDSAKIDGD